jgi:pSer/pThr/pTyr-binding forkhead associated (FHA) protein
MKDGLTRKLVDSLDELPQDEFFDCNRVTLVVASGMAAGSEFLIETPRFCVGRGPDVDLAFADDAMSSQHAMLELAESGFRVRDLASTNGVRVNGAEVLSADLKHGDRIELGGHELRFLHEKASREPKTFVISD